MQKVVLSLIGGLMLIGSAPILAERTEGVIVKCERPCDGVVAGIAALGGEIIYRYENIGAIAAVIPSSGRAELLALPGAETVFKDLEMDRPRPQESVEVQAAAGTGPIAGAELDAVLEELPANYSFNNALTGASVLHGDGETGAGVIVAVIDTGTVNRAGHALTGKVIGGENFVPGVGEPSATSSLNDSHGTWVGCMIAANAAYLFSDLGSLAPSLKIHAPDSIIPCDGVICPLGLNIVPMVGTAPNASLYALKTFAAAGGGAPTSRVVAAMDRAISLRRNFDAGIPSVPISGDGSEDNPFLYDSLDVQVVNMSLGGATLFAGHELDEELTLAMLDAGITIVNSAGNAGHAAMTGGGAGTGRGTLTSGAASTVTHERVLRDLQGGVGAGAFFRPADHHQMATFSSRGPSADGRVSTNASANGFASFAHGTLGCCSLVSGTSFSSPTMAGAAALLRGAIPSAAAVEVRNALIESANPTVVGDNSAPVDQGAGFIDLPAALALLQSGGVSTGLEKGPESASVSGNIASQGFKTINVGNGSRYSTHLADLMPGQVAHLFVRSARTTDGLTVSLLNVDPELPPADQNFFFGDELFVEIVDAPTSFAALRAQAFVNGDSTFQIDNPQTGLVRVAVMGAWTNAGRISADVVISAQGSRAGKPTAGGKVEQGELAFIEVDVPAGTAQVVFELSWNNHWGRYPTDDVDMILVNPGGGLDFSGATLNSPERVVINSPAAGTWTAVVQGFTVQEVRGGPASKWALRATADGKRLK